MMGESIVYVSPAVSSLYIFAQASIIRLFLYQYAIYLDIREYH